MGHQESKKSVSIMNIIIIMFVSVLFLTVSSIGYLIFSNWSSSSRQIVSNLAGEMNQSIYHEIDRLIDIPVKINEVNHKVIENGILDLTEEIPRDKFFVGVLSSYGKEIYSFSFGTANGEYYGARRNQDGIIEIMRNNAETEGVSWYYTVDEDLTAGELAVVAGKFDPRTRDWYKVAEQTNGPSFSPVYKHFVMDDLTVSAAYPVYDANGGLQGVLGTHMLLSSIGAYLEDLVADNQGYAFIIENQSGHLIANSLGATNFTVQDDKTLKRYTLQQMNHPDFEKAYAKYQQEHNSSFLYQGEQETLFFRFQEYHQAGIDWLIISAVPETLLIAEIKDNILLAIILSILAILLSLSVYYAITNKLLQPMIHLLKVSDSIASGNFSDRAIIARNDEIGKIATAFNKVADHLQTLINNLEDTVKRRTSELELNKDQLRLILDSTAEAIYGIDLYGNCTFCNQSCVKILGYQSQEDLLGKNMHNMIHHSKADGSTLEAKDCKILLSGRTGNGTHVDDEVFWKADGMSFDVEYYSYPQMNNGTTIGIVITFMDITERKIREGKIKYLSWHDSLTGLYNRAYFEETFKQIDHPDNLPLSVIFADLNGLKLTNDIFGHGAGDALVQKSAEILKQCCREDDLIARVGGDEFIILLPKTDRKQAEAIRTRIESGFSEARVAAIRCSISMGIHTKIKADQPMVEVLYEAENAMYQNKAFNRKWIDQGILNTLTETLHGRSAREKQHAISVRDLCKVLGRAMNLPNIEIDKLERAGYLHDLGKIVFDDASLHNENLEEEDYEKMQQHTIVGYRILNLFDETVDLAEIVYSHHERWDGKGYPRGLKGEEIPLLSRIISVVQTYERVLSREGRENGKNKAKEEIKEGAGTQFDPQIAKTFLEVIQ